MAKRNAWAEAIREQQEPVEVVHIEEYNKGRCKCGEGKVKGLSLSNGEIVRECICGIKFNTQRGVYF